jgi:putative cell wall-binding protein
MSRTPPRRASLVVLVSMVLLIPVTALAAPTQRIAGPDRYATAVALSQARFDTPPQPGAVVHITTGDNFPDALMAGPYVAGQHNAILLPVQRDTIPAVVDAELRRLNPISVAIIGGTDAVSPTVEAQLTTYGTSHGS